MSELDDWPDLLARHSIPERDRRASRGCNQRAVACQGDALDILAAVNGPSRERGRSGRVETVDVAVVR